MNIGSITRVQRISKPSKYDPVVIPHIGDNAAPFDISPAKKKLKEKETSIKKAKKVKFATPRLQ